MFDCWFACWVVICLVGVVFVVSGCGFVLQWSGWVCAVLGLLLDLVWLCGVFPGCLAADALVVCFCWGMVFRSIWWVFVVVTSF